MKRVIKPETGKPYWRINISDENNEPVLTIENFEYGWLTGEGVGKYYNSSENNHSFNNVSYVTKDRQEITKEVEIKLINMFYDNIQTEIKKYQKKIKDIQERINREKHFMKDDMFKPLTREKKLKRILK